MALNPRIITWLSTLNRPSLARVRSTFTFASTSDAIDEDDKDKGDIVDAFDEDEGGLIDGDLFFGCIALPPFPFSSGYDVLPPTDVASKWSKERAPGENPAKGGSVPASWLTARLGKDDGEVGAPVASSTHGAAAPAAVVSAPVPGAAALPWFPSGIAHAADETETAISALASDGSNVDTAAVVDAAQEHPLSRISPPSDTTAMGDAADAADTVSGAGVAEDEEDGFAFELVVQPPPLSRSDDTAASDDAAVAAAEARPPRFARAGDHVTVHYVGSFVEVCSRVTRGTS